MISSAKKQDKLMYLKMTWQQDILSGVLPEQDDNASCHEGFGLSHGHRYILAATRQISHRYRKLKVLQIGTSPINLAQAVCQELGDAMNSYTIMDTSDRAIAGMRRETISHDLPIRFGILDITRGVEMLYEPTALTPIDPSSFDLIIALKTSREKSVPLKSMRSFLKQGGFLLMTVTITEAVSPEATDATRKEIHEELQRFGFSGVDSLERNRDRDSSFVILSQALNDQVSFLRAPSDSTPGFSTRGTLLVIGGLLQNTKLFIGIIESKLRCVWDGEVIVIRSLTDLNSQDFEQVEAVLSLTELDYSVLENLSCDTFQGLHRLFDKSKIVLWVTHGARNQNPHQSGTIGLVRAVQAESPEKVLQLLDLDNIHGNESLVAESFLRLIGGVWVRDDNSSMLWTVEPELSVQGRRLLIPRVLFDKKRNDHLNSSRRILKAGNPSGFFSPNRTYVLIGLSGQMGHSITRWMVEGGARHVVITSR
jgi:pseurotin A synthetase (hybrid polyketide synthase/nonribosomal peptide synthetase)